MILGWYEVEGDWYYFAPETGEMTTRSKTIGGVYYKFSGNGKLSGATLKNGKYYFAGKLVVGPFEIEGVNYLFDKGGNLLKSVNAYEYDGLLYTTDENGAIVGVVEKESRPSTGFWEENGKTYYYIDDVMVVSDWVVVEEGTFFFDENGRMLTNTTCIIDNAVCLFGADGKLVSKDSLDEYNGFLALNNKTYHYTNGVMTLGWYFDNGNWYYFVPETGEMVTSGKTIGGVRYNFHGDGTLAGGTWKINTKGTKYYVAGNAVVGL